MHCAGQQLFP